MSEGTTLTFKQGKPKLDPGIIGGDVAVLTFLELQRDVKTRVGPADVMTFKEYPEHGWYANVTSLKRIATVYGADYSKWAGKPIVLIAVQSAVVGTGTVYLVRVTTEYDAANNRPRRYAWCVSQFGPEAVLLRTSTAHDKRTARRIARAWLDEPAPTEASRGLVNVFPPGVLIDARTCEAREGEKETR